MRSQLLAIAITCAGAAATPVSAAPPERVAEARSCHRFEWVAAKGLTDKAAMRIPVELDGTQYMFQLDTGAHISFVGAEEAQRKRWPSDEKDTANVRNIKVAGTPVLPSRLRLREGKEARGTVGLDLLLGTYVIIDYPRQRFCVLTPDRLPSGFDESVAWTKASLHHGKLFVPFKIGSELVDSIFYDTGASMFPLSVDGELWRQLTGKSDTATADSTLEVPSWGKTIALAGAPTKVPLEVAGIGLDDPLVYTNAAAPTFFRDQIGGGAQGLFGSVMFLDEIVILDLTPSMRFGLLRNTEFDWGTVPD